MKDDNNSDTTPPEITPAETGDTPTPTRRENIRTIVSTILILLIAPVIALLLTAFVFQSYQVDGPSMQETLHNNDRLIVWKLPRTWARITGHQYVPKRGDVIIFNEPGLSEFGQGDDKQLVKRVIGLPGDHIVVSDGAVMVYNAQHPKGFTPDTSLPYGKSSKIPTTQGDVDVTLAKNQIFVCGDNRPDSLDSRAFGPVSLDQVVGKLVVRILPLNQTERF